MINSTSQSGNYTVADTIWSFYVVPEVPSAPVSVRNLTCDSGGNEPSKIP